MDAFYCTRLHRAGHVIMITQVVKRKCSLPAISRGSDYETKPTADTVVLISSKSWQGKGWGNSSLEKTEIGHRKSNRYYRLFIDSLSYTLNRGWMTGSLAGCKGVETRPVPVCGSVVLQSMCVEMCRQWVHASINLPARSLMAAWVFVTVLFINKPSEEIYS